MQSFQLKENREGLYLAKPHGAMIADGSQTLIVMGRNYKNCLNKLLYFLEDKLCYGVLKFNKIYPISLEEFKERCNEHKISETDRTRWWTGKKTLFAYDFKLIHKFDNPKTVNVKLGSQVIIKEVEFLSKITYEEETEKIRENKKTEKAQKPHKFTRAEWTTKNGHPRCLICGDEPLTTDYCKKIGIPVGWCEGRGELSSHELALIFSSPGGKSRVSKKIVSIIPKHHTYCEPFAGSAAVLFAKEPSAVEVINDLDKDIAFAYRFVKKLTPEILEQLRRKNWTVNKAKFNKMLSSKASNDLDRFYRFLYLSTFSYGATRNRFGYDFKKTYNFDKLMKIKERLSKVTVMCKDYKEVIKQTDSETTVFYLDPPYPEEWKKVATVTDAFTKNDMKVMANLLRHIKGKFILSIDIRPEYREFFKGFTMKKLKFKRTFDVESKTQYELLIMNFEPDAKLSKPKTVKHWDVAIENHIQLIDGIPSIKMPKDKGYCEEGVIKPYMSEYFIYEDDFKGIYTFKKISNLDFISTHEKQPLHIPAIWLLTRKEGLTPYMLTEDAIETKTIPPVGHSWLPKEIENQIPRSMCYWIEGLEMNERLDRLEGAQNYMSIKRNEDNITFERPIGCIPEWKEIEIVRLTKLGTESRPSIAKKVNCSTSTVYEYQRKHGLL